MPLYRLRTDWTIPSGRAAQTVIHFESDGIVIAFPSTWRSYLAGHRDTLASGIVAQVSSSIEEIDEATGAIQQEIVGPALDPVNGNGAGSGSGPVADSTQLLLRWRTSDFVGGRRVQGRSFIPGLNRILMTGGNVNSATVAAWQSDMSDLWTAADRLVVYSRPVPGRAGSAHQVSSGSVWPELAVQRRRRNR